MTKYTIELIVDADSQDEASDIAEGIADAAQVMIGSVKRTEPRPDRPMADKVELKIGDTVLWDDREGWRGTVTDLPSPDTLSVLYKNGKSDAWIDRRMFTKEVKDGE